MKANGEPEKLYLLSNGLISYCRNTDKDVEYTQTDAFIKKACEFLKSYRQELYDGTGYIAGIINNKTIDDFVNYMKGE